MHILEFRVCRFLKIKTIALMVKRSRIHNNFVIYDIVYNKLWFEKRLLHSYIYTIYCIFVTKNIYT